MENNTKPQMGDGLYVILDQLRSEGYLENGWISFDDITEEVLN